MAELSPRKQLDGFVAKFDPAIGAAMLDDPDIRALMDACLKSADPPLDPKQKYRLIIKSISAKQRPRRP